MEESSAHKHLLLYAMTFVVAFLACTTYLALSPHLLGGRHQVRVSMDEDFGSDWTTEDGTPVTLSNLGAIPGFAEHGASIHRKLPSTIESGVELNFLSKNVTFHLRYGGNDVYSFDPDRNDEGMPYGAHFNFAPLSPYDAGKTVTLDLRPVYTDSAAQVLDMRISGTTPYIQRYVKRHGLSLLESIFILFVGIAVIVLRVALRRRQASTLDLLSLGGIAILLGLWSSAQTLVPQLITGLSPIIAALEYLSLLFVPYLIVRFAVSLLHPSHAERYELAARIVAIVSITATMLVAIAHSMDMHSLLIISHAQLVLGTVLVVCQLVSSFKSHGGSLMRGVREANRVLLIAFLIFCACALLDFVAFVVTAHSITDSAFFMRLGLFGFMVVLSIEAFHTSIDYMRRADHADAIEAIAYVDALTGIGNRTAWKIMRTEMDEALAEGAIDDALVCQFDVNFLKRVNDTYGHAAGDQHLKRAADTITRSFGTEGACYRTGGDEFTCLIVGINLNERLEQCEGLLELSMAEQNEMHEGEEPLSMAVGLARTSEVPAHTIKAAQALADQRMYENKRAMKCERVD